MSRRHRAVQRLGRFQLLAELGRGGMAELYFGHLLGVGGFAKPVAVKLMLPHLSQDKQFVDMFLAEARIAAKLSHPNICQVYELGEEHGQLYLAMEYLEGVTWEQLAAVLPEDPAHHARVTAGVLGQALDGLHYAHELGVIHRDVSPQNLFVTVDGVCKVLDFGVSKMMTEGTRTRSGVIKGKLPYMSPEQIAGDALDARADVFAAGVVLWEALTGSHLFHRATDYQIWNAVREEPVPPVSAHEPAFAPLDEVVACALERPRERRFASARAFAEVLRRAVQSFGGAAGAAELGQLVRTRCAERLAERARNVASAVASVREPEVASTAPHAHARRSSAADTVEEPAATLSMQLRAHSVAMAAPSRRRMPILLALAAAAALATTIAIVIATRDDATPTQTAALALPAADAGATLASDAREPSHATPPTVVAEPAPTPPPRRGPARVRGERVRDAATTEAAQAPGYFTVDSEPYAIIYIDGMRRAGDDGQTPLFRVPLAPGKHNVRAVLADGREQTFAIKIEPGKELNWRKLTWP